MMLWQNVCDAAQSIRGNALRSFLTMLSIVIGVGALIAMLSIGAGAQQRLAEQIRSLGANVVMVVPKPDRGATGPQGERARPVPVTIPDAEAIAGAVPGILAAAPALQLDARLVYGNRNWPTRVNGTTAAYFFVRDWPLERGRGFSRREERTAGRVALIGQTAAQRLFGSGDPVGREIRIANTPIRIIGLLASKGPSGSGRDQDDIVFVPYKTAKLRLGAGAPGLHPDKVTYVITKAETSDGIPAAIADITALLRQRHHVPPGAPAGFRVTDPAAAMAVQQRSSRTVGWLLAAIASISLIVGGISIMNIMLVSVTERTKEIGLRQALGARRRTIAWLFLTEALMICSLGGVIGIALGSAASWIVARLAGWQVLVTPEVVLAAVLSAGATGLVFGYFPARKAARLLPATALRSE